jgi:hypothetical protein
MFSHLGGDILIFSSNYLVITIVACRVQVGGEEYDELLPEAQDVEIGDWGGA